MKKSFFFLSFFLFCALITASTVFFKKNSSAVHIFQQGGEMKKSFLGFEGLFAVIAITDQEHFGEVTQLAEKLSQDQSGLSKGVFVLEYPDEDHLVWPEHSSPKNLWILRGFDGSRYALYPFSQVPSYYFIKRNQIASGPYEKRVDLLKAMIAEQKNNKA